MAVSKTAMERGSYQIFSVASNDPGVEPGSTPSNFRVKLGVPLYFPGGAGDWEMGIAFASFGTTGAGVYQLGTSVNQRTITGTQTTAVVAIIPAPAASTEFSYVPLGNIQLFYPISQELIQEVEIEIDPVGASPVISAVTPAVVTIVVRRVGAR